MSPIAVLHPLSDFACHGIAQFAAPHYWYEGQCPSSGEWLRLPRTDLAENIARGLMQFLRTDARYAQEGKMYGVLLVETPAGEQRMLKAFSGLLQGQAIVAGWVPPIPGRDRVAGEEAQTLAQLDAIKLEYLTLKHLPARQRYADLDKAFAQQLQELSQRHKQRQQERQQQRQVFAESLQGEALTNSLAQLDEQSRRDGRERRLLKQQREAALQLLRQTIEQADARLRELKQQRQALSRQLQAQMHAVYCLTNFAGASAPLQQLAARGTLPTGTGDCCAPKLLHYAATHGLKPLAMAEFWWGAASSKGDKVPGEFYGACAERCQPLMGFLLSGLSQAISPDPSLTSNNLPLLYEDEWVIAVNKPAGLLSVPGRYADRQDSVLSRLRCTLPNASALAAVHRLDQETSGILLLARDPQTHRQLSQQFQQRRVEKVYEAIVAGAVASPQGAIDLPLWGDPTDRPRQKVDWQRGKPSLTHYRVTTPGTEQTRIELLPMTGRTHQLRVHTADPGGLAVPILGDRLYGCTVTYRLHLHARELSIQHPQTGQRLYLRTETPF